MTKNIQHEFEDEVFFNLQKQRNKWAMTAVMSMALSVLCITCLILILPLSKTEPYVVMVDKTTGEAEKIAQVRPATMEQQDAVLQAEIVSYVSDRETYDPADNNIRLKDVMDMSRESAANSLAQIWSSESANYPPTVYGDDTKVRVIVKSISKLPVSSGNKLSVARIRIAKVREDIGQDKIARSFVITVGYRFEPNSESTLQDIWKNPLGFKVYSYRIDAETL